MEQNNLSNFFFKILSRFGLATLTLLLEFKTSYTQWIPKCECEFETQSLCRSSKSIQMGHYCLMCPHRDCICAYLVAL